MFRGREVVIVDAVRTPIRRGHPRNGAFRAVHPNELLGACFTAPILRSGLDPRRVGDVITGSVTQRGEQAINLARNTWLQAGLPLEAPGTPVDRQCGSGQQAVAFAAALIALGTVDVAIGGGVEHLSRLPLSLEADADDEIGTPWPQPLLDRYELVPQGISPELLAEQWKVSRHVARRGVASITSAGVPCHPGRQVRC